MASFPAQEFAIGAYNYRTLGLGYADLGGLLMRLALPYASNEGRSLAASLTALMNGVAYQTSAQLAAELGPFPRWEANAEDMRRVLRNHARATGLPARDITGVVDPSDDYEELNIRPQQLIASDIDGSELHRRITSIWRDVCAAKSFRNAQVTLIAPTGTISLVMDCDTSGIEPDFALIKHKQLAGGGSMRIVNAAVSKALHRLDYGIGEIAGITQHISQTGQIPIGDIQYSLKSEDLAVFDCAVSPTEGGRCLSPEAHVRMVAAVQPFLSGGVSKTVNLPASSTVDDVDRIYHMAHHLGLKSIAIYRDGSKLTQPLSTANIEKKIKVEDTLTQYAGANYTDEIIEAHRQEIKHEVKTILSGGLLRGERERLPWHRSGQIHKMRVGGQSLYLHTGEYNDGRLGEFFLTMSKEGSTARALVEGFAKCASIALQHGVPLETLCDAFTSVRFEPSGIVEGHDEIKMCSSILDLVFRHLSGRYLHGRTNFAQDLAKKQQPLGEVFQKVLDENRYELYVASTIGAAQISRAEDICPECGHHALHRSGTCFTCHVCRYTTGCG
jgi:ribonucleoside-diphosphate reductase alpha chain